MMIGHTAFNKKYPEEHELAQKLNNKWDCDMLGRVPWECSCAISKKKLGELTYWIFYYGGSISSSFQLMIPGTEEQCRYIDVFFVVWLKPSVIESIKEKTKNTFLPSGKVHVN